VFIKAQNNDSLITSAIPKEKALKIPIAHGEGNYFNDAESLKKMNDNGQILFRYCDEKGNINPESNPNGSIENIAGICNERKNVFLFVILLTNYANLFAQKDSVAVKRDSAKIEISGYVDAYYAFYTDSVGTGNFQKFPSVSPRSNQFGLNVAMLTAKYSAEKV